MRCREDLRVDRSIPVTALAIGLIVGAIALPATAQEQEQEALAPVVVTASGHEQRRENAPASISVIDRETLEKRQFNDVTDALRTVPGVTITGGGSGDNGADISIRGMPAGYTLLLVDGQRVSTRETRPNGSAGFEQHWLPPLQAIERIEVIRGPMSTLYGSDAMGGVINVITRKVPEEWRGSIQIGQVIQEDSDSGDSHRGNFYASGPLNPGLLGMRISGEYSSREEDDIVDGYEERQLKSLNTRFTLTPDKNHEIAFETGITHQNRQGTVGKSVAPPPCRFGCSDYDSTYTNEHYSLSHEGRLSFGTVDSHIKREVAENRTRDIEITNTNAKTSLMMPLGNHITTLGASYTLEELYDGTTNQISDRTDVERWKYAIFLEDEWLMTRTFSLTGGLRADDDEIYGSHLSPRLYGVWNAASRWTVKGGISSGYRSPDLRAITPDWGQVSRGGNVYGNPELEPETSVNKELSVLYSGASGMNASLTIFHNRFEDKINRVQCPASVCTAGPNQFGSEPTYRVNVDEAVTQGVEASLDAALSENVTFTSSYTYTDSEQKTGEYKGEPLTQLPKQEVTAELEWRATPTLTPWTRLTYRDEETQPVTGPSQDALVAPSYTFIDAGLGYQLTSSARINAGIYNLADEEITSDEYGYVEDGRRLWVSLTTDF